MLNLEDLKWNTKRDFFVTNPEIKTPLTHEHYPYAPDEADINMLENYECYTPERIQKTVNENENLDYVGDNADFLRQHMNVPLRQNRIDYDPYLEVCKISCGFKTTYKPDYTRKFDNWEAKRPEDDIAGETVIENEYLDDPYGADNEASLPPYLDHMSNRLNITKERLELFSKIFLFLFLF